MSGVTCHLHFGQNDQGLLHANAVTLGGMGTEYSVPRNHDGHKVKITYNTDKRQSKKTCEYPYGCHEEERLVAMAIFTFSPLSFTSFNVINSITQA